MEKNLSTHGIGFKDKLGYALGDAGGLLTFSLISAYLQMFYTDVLHIPLAQITVLMLVARIWDAINDPMWGAFIDSRKPSRHGRFRPYILGASIPMAFAAILMFTKIPGLSQTQYLIFAYVTYILYGMLYTGVNIPYGSLASVITDDEIERSSLSMWRSIGAGFGGLPAQILLPLFVYTTIESTGEKVLDANKLTICVAILAVASIGIYFAHFKMTKERVSLPQEQKKEDFNVLSTIKMLLKNKPFIVLCLVSMLLICFQMYTQTTYNYLLKNYYGKPGLYSLITVCTYLPMAMFIPFMSKLVRKFGKKEICAVGLGFAAVINILMYVLKFTPFVSNPYVFLVLVFFSGAGQTFLVLEVWALVTDVIDYHELLSKRREEGTSYAFFSFTRKLGQTVAGAGSSALLGFIGYDVTATDIGQSQEVIAKLYDISTLIPAIILSLMFVLLAFGYKLSKKNLAEMHKALEIQRSAE
ncbi:MAG: MFS transporter [Acutalibacteraceae bacterium]